MRRTVLLCTILILLFASLAVAVQQPKVAKVERPEDIPTFFGYVPGEIIVQFKMPQKSTIARRALDGTLSLGIQSLDVIAQKYNVTDMRQEFPGAEPKLLKGRLYDLSRYHVVKFDPDADLDEVMEAYRNDPNVESVEPIGIHRVYATPNDGNYASQWHLNQANDHDVDAPEAWNIETGSTNVVVAILDTGVRYFHKDLGGSNASYSNPSGTDGNVWINWAEKNGTAGVDDDNNGYVDDWVGWDFVDGASSCWNGEDCNTEDNDPRDFNGHGTHCAGNVAAINNNGYATCATSGGWGDGTLQPTGNGVKVMPCRVGWSGTYFIWEVGYVRMDFAASAFYYAADNGAKIASCSWGSSNSGGLDAAIDYFLASGGMIFKVAGNDGNSTADYMGSRTDIINVAATDTNDCKADFSNYGTWVDISAPGTGIVSLYHNHSDSQNDYVATMDGTSMATPIAASVAALIWSHNPTWTASQVEQQLYSSADNIDNLSCNSSYTGKLGAGRVNAYNAVNTGTPPPVASFSGTPTSGCAALTVNFTDESTGDITSWSWDFGDGGTSTAQNPSHTYNSGGTYTVALTVTGSGGSDTDTKTDYITVSVAPTADFVGSPTSGTEPLTVNFTDQSTGGPTSWSWDFGDGNTSTAQNPSHTYNTTGTYTVSLIATNSCGNDTLTKVDYITVDTCHVPAADFVGSPTSGDAPLTVNFTDQSTNNPTSWSWDFGDGGTSTAQNPSYTYDTAGTYTVTMTATNSCGNNTQTKVDYITVTQPPVSSVVGEVGKIVRNQTGAGADWYTVNLNNTYTDAVVVMRGLSYNGGDPTHLRVRNVSTTSFEWQMEEWDYKDGNHTTETCPYMVAESGVHTLEDGTVMQAGVASAATSWVTVTFPQAFSSTPTLITGVTSQNDTAACITRTRNLTATSFQIKVQEEEAADNVHSAESVAWIAIEQTSGNNNGTDFISARTSNSVKHKWYTINFSSSFSATPIFLCHDDTYDGGNTCGTRYRNLGTSSVEVKIEEEKSKDNEVSHTTEVVSYVAWGAAGDIKAQSAAAAASTGKEQQLMVASEEPLPEVFNVYQNYPNPFNPTTEISFSLPKASYVTLDIYNILGQHVNTLFDGTAPAGITTVTWDATNFSGNKVSSGIYFYRLNAKGYEVVTKKMLLLK